jgi:hypothetical protein
VARRTPEDADARKVFVSMVDIRPPLVWAELLLGLWNKYATGGTTLADVASLGALIRIGGLSVRRLPAERSLTCPKRSFVRPARECVLRVLPTYAGRAGGSKTGGACNE